MSERGIGRVVTTAPPSPGFIEDIRRLSELYVEEKMPRMSELAQNSNRKSMIASGAENNKMTEAMSGDRH